MSYSRTAYHPLGQTTGDAVVVAGAQLGGLGLMALLGFGLWILMAPKGER